jgi:hypothetical protein
VAAAELELAAAWLGYMALLLTAAAAAVGCKQRPLLGKLCLKWVHTTQKVTTLLNWQQQQQAPQQHMPALLAKLLQSLRKQQQIQWHLPHPPMQPSAATQQQLEMQRLHLRLLCSCRHLSCV